MRIGFLILKHTVLYITQLFLLFFVYSAIHNTLEQLWHQLVLKQRGLSLSHAHNRLTTHSLQK
jgi:hypothetical protein